MPISFAGSRWILRNGGAVTRCDPHTFYKFQTPRLTIARAAEAFSSSLRDRNLHALRHREEWETFARGVRTPVLYLALILSPLLT